MRKISKTDKRTKFLNRVLYGLKDPEVYGTLNYVNESERSIKMFIYPFLLNQLFKYYKETKPLISGDSALDLAKKSLLWEGNVNTTINNIVFLGTQHRPDFVIDNDIKIAVEVKKGDRGSSVREGIGQSMVYSMVYDFVIYLFIDTSKDKRIINSLEQVKEKSFINELWDNHNILFGVI